MKRFFLAALSFLTAIAQAAPLVIPDSRRMPSWEPHVATGVVGGIVNRPTGGGTVINVTLPPYNADNTGMTDAAGAIQAAITAASAGDVVYCPSGTYLMNGTVQMNKSNITLRGDGCGEPGEVGLTTFLRNFDGDGSLFETILSLAYNNPSAPHSTVASGGTRNATTVTLASGAGYATGYTAQFQVPNDPTIPIVQDRNELSVRFWPVLITGVSSNTITFTPPLPYALTGISNVVLYMADVGGYHEKIGYEDFVVEIDFHTGITSGIKMDAASVNCWVKNVSLQHNNGNYFVSFVNTINCEFTHSRIEHGVGGTSHSGFLVNTTSNTLVTDSIFTDVYLGINCQQGGIGLTILDNFWDKNLFDSSITLNHGPYPFGTLVEGNITPQIYDDGYFGGSQFTLHRNWATGLPNLPSPFPTQVGVAIYALRFGRDANVIGNIVFAPGYDWSWANDLGMAIGFAFGGAPTTHHVSPSTGSYWKDWDSVAGRPRFYPGTVTSVAGDGLSGSITLDAGVAAQLLARDPPFGAYGPNSAQIAAGNPQFLTLTNISGNTATFNQASGVVPLGAITILGGPNGFYEIDDDVFNTMTLKANYNYKSAQTGPGIPVDQNLSVGTTLADSYAWTSTPPYFTAASLPWPAINPFSPDGLSASSIPAGKRFFSTVQGAIQSAVLQGNGTTIVLAINKPMTLGGGPTTGFTISSSGVTFTYDSISGASIIGHTSRVMFASESFTLAYTGPTPPYGFVDDNGNGLQNKSAFGVTNQSLQTGNSIIYWAGNPASGDGFVTLTGPGTSRVSYVNVLRPGIVDKIPVGIGTNTFGGGFKIGVWSPDGTTLEGQAGGSVTKHSENQFFTPVSSFHIAAGLHKVAIQSANNNDPSIVALSGMPAGTTKYEFTPYVDFPPATMTSEVGSDAYALAVGLQVIPDAQGGLSVTGTLRITGTVRFPP